MGVTLEELLDHYGLQESQLDQRCTNAHLNQIALHMDKWEVYASFLDLTPADIDDIKEDGRSNLEKKIQALNKWKTKNAIKATLKSLANVFLDAQNAVLAEEVCKLLIDTDSTDRGPTSGSGQRNEKPHPPAVVQCDLPPWKPANKKLNLLNISNAIRTVVDWSELGKQLGLPSYKLQTIKIDQSAYGQPRMKDEMISFWLQSDLEASWEKLCTALDNMDQRAVAKQIRDTLRKMTS